LFLSLSVMLLAGTGASMSLATAAPPGAVSKAPPRMVICPLRSSAAVLPCCGPIRPVTGTEPAQPIFCCPPIALPHSFCCLPIALPHSFCCPPIALPHPFCCPPNALCVDTLTIAAAPNPATAPADVVVSGRLLLSGADTKVILYQELPGQTSFHAVARTSTDASGRYKFLRSGVETNREWFVTAKSGASEMLQLNVHARVTLSAPTVQPGVLPIVTLIGHVTPNHAAEPILLQQRELGRWHVIGQTTLSKGSSYVFHQGFTTRGTVALRAVFPGDARNIVSASPTLTLEVS
jgi:hypothetical protein